MKQLLSLVTVLFISLHIKAQSPVSLTDDGSTVVVGGLVLIFLGFFYFLWRTERRISKIEKDNKS